VVWEYSYVYSGPDFVFLTVSSTPRSFFNSPLCDFPVQSSPAKRVCWRVSQLCCRSKARFLAGTFSRFFHPLAQKVGCNVPWFTLEFSVPGDHRKLTKDPLLFLLNPTMYGVARLFERLFSHFFTEWFESWFVPSIPTRLHPQFLTRGLYVLRVPPLPSFLPPQSWGIVRHLW